LKHANDNGPRAYYNEFDPQAAAWLRELIRQGHIAPGDVDERSIVDVRPYDLVGYTQCHFFAGIGVWSYALRQAGWPDDRPVWTGSCPCQPFSAAGKGNGFDDERHLWPAWFWLIQQSRPAEVFGEQVASKDADPWVDLVQDDLEALGYAFGAVPFPAAGVGTPNIRDRLYWTASGVTLGDAFGSRLEGLARHGDNCNEPGWIDARAAGHVASAGELGGLADSATGGWREERADGGGRSVGDSAQGLPARSDPSCASGRLANPDGGDACAEGLQRGGQYRQRPKDSVPLRGGFGGIGHNSDTGIRPGATNGFWSDPDWLFCRDGKWRPVESGTFPLAHGAPARVGRLRGYGNAINAQAAIAFIQESAVNDNATKLAA